ncbi:MAG TPA: family 1 glycosylhydrolase [Pyrinomonadaceae bacterium]|jgi:dTDP-4-dehydrorhamnose reductase|nr:family 1 glycosylhydrolase [Pyrinomonadaceae bacterium]
MSREHLLAPALELWAGVECTVNRVGDEFFDQLERNGHARRAGDLEMFAALGMRALRYPVLWERTAPESIESADWSWADERLARLRELGIRPIVGLVHHGSGPRHTSLVDPEFPTKLADYARAVAERYPWVESFTPVNEPLTTARFSGLYGHWYPHGRDHSVFARTLVTQTRGVVEAMRAIREVNPAAKLVQTEDLGKTFSTPKLAYQAEFENERRWLSFDLLVGRVNREHPLWDYLCSSGIAEAELDWFVENPCPPDVLGINHYLTSERFLDERTERYPACTHGGNGQHAYADVEAVRVCAEGVAGPRVLLREAWERYGLPLAVTEAHLGCTREEQMRWLGEVWAAARQLRAEGVDVRAVTAWSLLGAYDWMNLLTCARGQYEPGVFDLRGPQPRPTALAHMLRDLAAGREHEHPVLSGPGWWRRLDRLLYPPVRRRARTRAARGQEVERMKGATRPLLITGATGTLGNAFARLCEVRGLSYRLLTRAEMDIADAASVCAALDEFEPWAIVNTAGYVRVDDAERDSEACRRENADGPATLADACAQRGVKLLTFSSDLVFGEEGRAEPYVESDRVAPLNVYGRTKAEAETLVLEKLPDALVIRTSAFFGPWDEYNFITAAIRALSEGREFVAADDQIVSPTYVPDLVNTSLDLLIDGERGLWHLATPGAITWAELARRAAELAGLDARGVVARPTRALGLTAARPAYSVLSSERGVLLPPFEDALARYAQERATFFGTTLARKQSGAR